MCKLVSQIVFAIAKNKQRLAACILSSLFLAGYPLAVAAEQMPQDAADSGLTLTAQAQSDSKSSETLELTLDQAAQEGLNHNLDLMAAKFSVPMAEADELTAGLLGNPSLLVDTAFEPFGGNWNQTSAGGPRQFDAGVSLPVDLSGKRSAGVKSAHAMTQITQVQFMDAVRQEILLIRQSYIDVVTQQHQVALAKERAENYDKLVHIIENRIGFKKVQPLLLMRAQLAGDQARMDLRQKENDLRSSKTMLAIQLGRQPHENAFEATTELRQFEIENVLDKDTLVALALSHRPDLNALQMTLAKAQLDHRLAQNQMWDDATVTLQLSNQGSVAADPNDADSAALPSATSWDAALSIPFPLLNQNQGNVEKADLAAAQTQKQIEALQLSISQEIGDELAQLEINRDLIAEYESKQIRNARMIRDEQQKLFGTGNMVLLDYFDAMEAYNGVLSAYYNTVGSYRKGLAQINASVGKDVIP